MKNKDEFRFVSFLFFSVLVFLTVFLAFSNIRMFQRRIDIKNQINDKKEEIAKFSQETKQMEYPEEYSLERMIRDQLLMRKEGEEVVFVSFPEEEKEEEYIEQEIIWWNPSTWRKE